MKNKYLIIITYLFSLSTFSQIVCDVKKQKITLASNLNGEVSIGMELTVGRYKDTNLKNVLDFVSQFNEKDRLLIPEYLIIRQLNLIKKGDSVGVVGDFFGKKALDYAKQNFTDIKIKQDDHSKIKDIHFITKSYYGKFIKIKYKYIYNDGSEFFWGGILSKVDNRFYFVDELDDHDLFYSLTEAYPFWIPESQMKSFNDNGLEKVEQIYKNDLKYNESSYSLFFRINSFPEKSFAIQELSEEELKLKSFLRKASLLAKGNKVNSLKNMFVTNLGKWVEMSFSKGKQSNLSILLKTADDLNLVYYITTDKEYLVYVRPVFNGKLGRLGVIRVIRQNEQLKLSTGWGIHGGEKLVYYSNFIHFLEKKLLEDTQDLN